MCTGHLMGLVFHHNRLSRFLFFLLLLSIVLSFMGCGKDADVAVVDFSKRLTVKRPDAPKTEPPILRVAVAAMTSPKETFAVYRLLIDYIAGSLGHKVQFIQRKTYGEINALIGKGEVDLAFICSGPYVTERHKYGFEALAVPQIRKKHSYQSYLIVNKNSSATCLENLRGKLFAFTDPESNTGKLVPTYWITQKGEVPESFFDEIMYTYSHDNAILAVARSLVDGAAVHSQIWEYFNVRNPAHTSKTRILMKSEPFGNPPIVASAHMSTHDKKRIQQLLLTLHENPEGKQILNQLLMDRFIEPRIEWYAPILRMNKNLSRFKES